MGALGFLSNLKTRQLTPEITTSTGDLYGITAYQFGNVVFLNIAISNSNNITTGSNIFVGTISNIPLPAYPVTAGGYYKTYGINGMLISNGQVIFKNTSNSTITFNQDDSATLSFTYVAR